MITESNSSSPVLQQLVYTARQLEPVLGMSHQKIKRLARNGTIPGRLVGRSYTFILEDVITALKNHVVKSTCNNH